MHARPLQLLLGAAGSLPLRLSVPGTQAAARLGCRASSQGAYLKIKGRLA